jgi:hypothetical protein
MSWHLLFILKHAFSLKPSFPVVKKRESSRGMGPLEKGFEKRYIRVTEILTKRRSSSEAQLQKCKEIVLIRDVGELLAPTSVDISPCYPEATL